MDQSAPPTVAGLATRLRLYKAMVTRINAGLGMQQILDRSLLEVSKVFPGMRLSCFVVEDDLKLHVLASVSPKEMARIKGLSFDGKGAGSNPIFERFKRGEIVAYSELDERNQAGEATDDLMQQGAKAAIGVPMSRPDQKLGFITLTSAEPHQWTEFETAVLCDLAEYLAVALRDAKAQDDRREIEKRLRESQKMQAVGRLVGGIAHDFNNLLTAIMIYCGLLGTALGLEHRLRRHVDEIRQAGERGAALVGQLLALSKQQIIELRIMSLNQVVSEMADMLQRLIGEDMVMVVHLAEDLKTTKLDPTQMQQVILNLAINAHDAMPGGGRLFIETSNLVCATATGIEGVPKGEYVQLTVTDNGTGMDAATKSQIFEPFFTTKGQGKGTGLGLATVYGIVHQHNGHITVDSTPGHGTTFAIVLPVAKAAEAESTATGKLEAGQQHQTKVLLVEDEELVRTALVESLRTAGYLVTEACDAEDALGKLEAIADTVHLLVTDLVMPGMNGRELFERVTAILPELPVLFISGYTDDPRTRELIRDGAQFLRKPFSPAQFTEKVRSILERDRQRSSGAA